MVCRRVKGLSGANAVILENTRRLVSLGWSVDVYGAFLDQERIREAGGHPVQLWAWPWGSWAKRFSFAKNFAWQISKKDYAVVHGHGDVFCQDVLSLHNCVHAAHEAVHGRDLPADNAVGRLHARQLKEQRFQALLANSNLMAEDVVRRFGVAKDKVVVVYPGHDPRRFCTQDKDSFRQNMRVRLGVNQEEVLAGLITSGDFVKRGVRVFVESVGKLEAALKKRLRVLVVGKENKLSLYRSLVQSVGMGGRFVFKEPIQEVERLFHALDIYVHPAAFEEFGLSVQEAMACGVPVLSTRQVGATELMPPEYQEHLFDKGQADALSAKLKQLIENVPLRERLGVLGAECVRENTWDMHFKKTMKCYEKIVMAKGKGHRA